jgi:hypothetical protein
VIAAAMLGAALVAADALPQGSGRYACMMGTVAEGLDYDAMPATMDQPWSITIHGLREKWADGEENLDLPTDQYAMTGALFDGAKDVSVNIGASNQLTIYGRGLILAISDGPAPDQRVVRAGPLRDDKSVADVRGLCTVTLQWPGAVAADLSPEEN